MTRVLFLGFVLLTISWLACDGGGGDGTMDVTPGGGEDASAPGVDSIPGEDAEAELPPACENECGFFGEKECVGEGAWRECVPEGSCLVWGPEQACEAGSACEDGECVEAFGDLDCLEISTCMGQCNEVQACQQDCFKQGSEQGQEDWTDLAVCIDTQCGDLFAADKPAAGGKCTLEECKDSYLVCTPVGTESCKDSLTCLQGCNGDNACIGACLLDADYDALLDMADIMVCFENNCPDPAEWEACATTTCLMPVLGCL